MLFNKDIPIFITTAKVYSLCLCASLCASIICLLRHRKFAQNTSKWAKNHKNSPLCLCASQFPSWFQLDEWDKIWTKKLFSTRILRSTEAQNKISTIYQHFINTKCPNFIKKRHISVLHERRFWGTEEAQKHRDAQITQICPFAYIWIYATVLWLFGNSM